MDNTIDTADYMVLKRLLLGKIDTLPIIPSEYGKSPTPTIVLKIG